MAGEKQFEATHSHLERAKREGDVARSQELGNVAAFAAALGSVGVLIAPLASAARGALIAASAGRVDAASCATAAALMLVPIAAAAAAALGANVVQSGGLRLAAVSFKTERLSPGENLKRMFSREVCGYGRASDDRVRLCGSGDRSGVCGNLRVRAARGRFGRSRNGGVERSAARRSRRMRDRRRFCVRGLWRAIRALA